MRLPCFSRSPTLEAADAAPPRKRTINRASTAESARSTASRASTASNWSISRLPPCKRDSDAKVEAMMMPLPAEPRASRCLRLSQPKTYSNIVHSMKSERGSRDWKSFPVFPDDEVDMADSANERARRKTVEHARKMRAFSSFTDQQHRDPLDAVDMIGSKKNKNNKATHGGAASSPESEIDIQKKLKAFYNIDLTPPERLQIPEARLAATLPSPPRSRQRPPSNASSKASATSSDSSSSGGRKRPAPYDGLLMRESDLPVDPEWNLRHQAARRRVKRFIFENFDEVDWRSCPTVEETSFQHKTLWHRRDLRCIASPHYLHGIANGWHRPSYDSSLSGSDVLTPEEDMFDMIG
ncbi:Hypothetical predicted protein [Lecanosticta acicola]|uniref:Uncharacterized protein n=1 Tax=Lecanosticta acicola TaxID=111012 RepID=A0AAI8Z8N2_9PEZI|nr:Hypothetical predicted protein [Lecanosticta acicola]